MDSEPTVEERQENEILSVRSIYPDDFIEPPPPKAWKGAARLPEFIIRIKHSQCPTKVNFHLLVRFPKTYPAVASPTFTIQKPIQGLNNDHVTKLTHAIAAEVQKYRGREVVFEIIILCEKWLERNIAPPVEVPGSLALQMTQRAMDEEKARQQRAAEEAEKEKARVAELAQQREEQIRAEALRQLIAREQEDEAHQGSRTRANSSATEVPVTGDIMTETFSEKIEIDDMSFNAVKLFHPRLEGLGTVYMADPICDDIHASYRLELYKFTFDSPYYSTSQGRKKLRQVEQEIQRLTAIHHENDVNILAVKLSLYPSSNPSQLLILSQETPALKLHDVLAHSTSLRHEHALDYIRQVLAGLSAIHDADLVHRGISANSIGIDTSGPSSVVKLARVGFPMLLLDLHRSNPFASPRQFEITVAKEPHIPEGWLSRDERDESLLLHTPQRDIHAVGIVLMQMLLGLDVTERYVDAESAIDDLDVTLENTETGPVLIQLARYILLSSAKNISCEDLLNSLEDSSALVTSQYSLTVNAGLKTPMPISNGHRRQSSPEVAHFRMPYREKHVSRWKEDWEELELLGKGAFGSVVKARNKLDSRIYAVKKVRLKANRKNDKIFREVNTLSKLNHRFIVRYYTAWLETSDEPPSTVTSDDSEAESGTEDARTSVPDSSEGYLPTNGGGLTLDFPEDPNGSYSNSFPSIHFQRSTSPATEGELSSGSDDGFGNFGNGNGLLALRSAVRKPPAPTQTLYIQMEFVERQTLKERIDEGLSEAEAWRLFQQLLEALVHMAGLEVLHRDIKLTNIFIDSRGDCKVGDFGLATTSKLAAVEPGSTSPHGSMSEGDMTLEVGTRLYIAPELTTGHNNGDQSKADMYSLGIVFFEMNYKFTTASERIAVIEDLRKEKPIFPMRWNPNLVNQRKIIEQLLNCDIEKRPTAVQLLQSPLLPSRVEDEHFRDALQLISNTDSPHRATVLSSFFNRSANPAAVLLYDLNYKTPDHAALNSIVSERLAAIFRLHGAVDMEPALLVPTAALEIENEPNVSEECATFLDKSGDHVSLPPNLIVPFARLATRGNTRRIKRYHIANVFKKATARQPLSAKAAVFDIITPDLVSGPIAAGAEVIAVISAVLDSFPNLAKNYEIQISHSKIIEVVLDRLPAGQSGPVVDTLTSQNSQSQKRATLLKGGLLRSTADELELLCEVDDDVAGYMARLNKVSPTLVPLIKPYVNELQNTIKHANAAGVARPIYFHPLLLDVRKNTQHRHAQFKNGILIEVVHRTRHDEVLAIGGRYDHLIGHSSMPSICALGIQIAMDKITSGLAAFQSSSVKTLLKEGRSFGYWSPRRCDVYVVSYHPGYLQDRLELVAYLWEHNISADIMYESGLPDLGHEDYVEQCLREGILFTVYPRPRGRRETFKVKSILKGTEYELSRQELVGWLQHQIAEQKKIDMTTSGAPKTSMDLSTHSHGLPMKETASSSDVQLVLPADTKKQRKQVKQMFLERAYETAQQLKSAAQSGLPTLAVDVPPAMFDAMVRNTAWITEEDAWKAIVATVPTPYAAYVQQIREAAAKRKAEGHRFVLLFAVRDERVQLLALS